MMNERDQWEAVRDLCTRIDMPGQAVEALRTVYEAPDGSRLTELRSYASPLADADAAVASRASRELLARAGMPQGASDTMPAIAVTVLAVYLEAALRSWETIYVPRGVDRDVFDATMANMALFVGERLAAYGDVRFDRAWWCWQYTSGRQYRIGELNVEMALADGTGDDGEPFAAGTRLVHIHIPSDADMDPGRLHETYRAARAFVRRVHPQWADAPMVTETWLLSPTLRDLLRPDSRILAFASDFDVLHVDAESDAGTFFVFGRTDLPSDRLPQRTGLQRAAAALLQRGGHIGVAFGRLREP